MFSGDGSVCLASSDGTEGYQKFVVDRSGIVKERADNFLNAAFTLFVKELGSVCFWGELGLSAIGDWQTLVRGETWLEWMGMLKLNEQVFDVPWHADATATICIVPFDINTRKFISGHVALDPVEFLENVQEVVEVFNSNIFYTKVIYNEAELSGMPFVAPEARGGFSFIIAFSKKAGSEEIVGENAGLGKAIAASANFEVDPTVAVSTSKLVLFNEFPWDVYDFDADILRVGHWGIKVEVLEVDGAEARTFAREYTVEQQLEEFKGRRVGADISRVTDATASDGDAGTISIVFIRSHFTHYHGVADFLLFVSGDVMIVDDKEGVSARNLFGGGGGSRTNSLTQSS